jgi:hypothetical protein
VPSRWIRLKPDLSKVHLEEGEGREHRLLASRPFHLCMMYYHFSALRVSACPAFAINKPIELPQGLIIVGRSAVEHHRDRQRRDRQAGSFAAQGCQIQFGGGGEHVGTRRAQLDDADALMTFFAADLMEGNRFSVTISNPEIISLHRALAQHIGASVEEIELGASTEMVFGPLAR